MAARPWRRAGPSCAPGGIICGRGSLKNCLIGSVRARLEAWQAQHGHLPICMAKTPYSFSADPRLQGAPTGFTVPVREVRLAAGAGFVVAICGDIMTMPGLPRDPAANRIGLDAQGRIEGLF